MDATRTRTASATFPRRTEPTFPATEPDTELSSTSPALRFRVVAQQGRARASVMDLPRGSVETPTYMAVGTQGTVKALTSRHLQDIGCQIILANTFHMGHRPGGDAVEALGGVHRMADWPRPLLTDSGGFQMVSLLALAEITEHGVRFASPHDGSEMVLTPEHSIHLQNQIGSDIAMQLDDVVHSSVGGPRLEEAMQRSVRWLDRCLAAHERRNDQNIFAIVQGGLDGALRRRCLAEMVKRDTPGYAIGGLSGGESKDSFWRMVDVSTEGLPANKPRYLMGVGYAVDMVCCVALGVDTFDCVYATRTARFGNALVPWGVHLLTRGSMRDDQRPIVPGCQCHTCRHYSRAYLYTVAAKEVVGATLISIHNVHYLVSLMAAARQAIVDQRFPQFVRRFMRLQFDEVAAGEVGGGKSGKGGGGGSGGGGGGGIAGADEEEPRLLSSLCPQWVRDALAAAEIELDGEEEA